MKTIDIEKLTVGEIVAMDNTTAAVFMNEGIDFCCGGNKTLAESCAEKGIDSAGMLRKLVESHARPGAVRINYNEWEPGFLCDYIVNVHHTYVKKAIPELLRYTQKIAEVHGSHHPELIEVAGLFSMVSDELQKHLKREEEILFPSIRELFSGQAGRSPGVINNEIKPILAEHEFAGGTIDRIKTITGGYKLPDDACNSYRVTFSLLEQFEHDLHIHVHLENNILIPKTQAKLHSQ